MGAARGRTGYVDGVCLAAGAAEGGHLELKWARENGCNWEPPGISRWAPRRGGGGATPTSPSPSSAARPTSSVVRGREPAAAATTAAAAALWRSRRDVHADP